MVLYAYARGEDEYLFVPERLWEERSQVMQAFFMAGTWGEFWSLLPESEETTLRRWLEERAEEEEPEDAARYRPRDEDFKDIYVLPGVEEGDYPDQLHHCTPVWFSRALIADLQVACGMPQKSWSFTFKGDGGPLSEVEKVFARHGYRLVWDAERVRKASGWWWSDASMGTVG